jgi:signal transduction histidine kinase
MVMREIALTRTCWGTGLAAANLFLTSLLGVDVRAMAVDEGRPLVRAFSPSAYDGATDIEALAVAPDGMLLAAAGGDVVTYDGACFDRIETPIPRLHALAVSDDGARIYVGGDDRLGVIERGDSGRWSFQPLVDALPTAARPLGRIAAIATSGQDAWFAAEGKLLRLRGRTLSVIPLEGGTTAAIVRGADALYVQRAGEGLFRIEGDRVAAVSNDRLVTEAPIVGVFPVSGGLVVAQHRQGLVRIEAGRARVANTALAALAEAEGVIAAVRTASAGFVLRTSRGEIVVTDPEGRIENRHVLSGGGPSAMTIDRDGSLWVATSEGLVQISMLGAVTRFDAGDGLPRSSFTALVRHRGSLIVAAADGLHALRPGTRDGTTRASFVKLPGDLPQPADLLVAGGDLYASGAGGIWLVEPSGTVQIYATAGRFTDLASSSLHPDTLLAGGEGGLTVLRREGERLVLVRAFKDFGEVRSILDDPETGIWVGTTSKGIHRIVLPAGSGTSGWSGARTTTYDAKSDRIGESGGPFIVGLAPGGPIAIGQSRLYRYEATADAFRPDDRFAFDGVPASRLWPVAIAGPQRFWASASFDVRRSSFPLARVERVAGGLWKVLPAPAPVLEGLDFAGASPILLDAMGEDEVVWAGGYGELYRIRAAEIRRVPPRPMLAFSRATPLSRQRQPVRFSFGAPSLLPGSAMEYRWRLEAFDDAWSAWSASREAVFSSLPTGAYQLEVEARDRTGTAAAPTSARFRVPTPPWLSWWAWSGYALLAGVAYWGAVKLRAARSDAERDRLEQLVAERTSEAAAAREAAEEAERAKSRFLARMGEQLKPPLDKILGFAQTLARDPDLAAKHRENLGAVHASGKRLLALIEEISDLARVQEGSVELRDDAFSLTALIRDVETAFVAQSRERGPSFVVATRDLPHGPVVGDARRLRQVLEHLVGGAMQGTERGEVRLKVIGHPRSEMVHFAVSDTGAGVIPDEPEAELGLSLSRRIVELLGGRLEIASQPGEGTTAHFSILLPESAEESPRPVLARRPLDAPRPPA